MIYMRDRHQGKKKKDEQQLVKRLILDEIKHKITQVGHTCQPVQQQSQKSCEPKTKVLYSIAGKGENQQNVIRFSQQKMCESIVVGQSLKNKGMSNEQQVFRRMSNLATQKCFDIQVISQYESQEQEMAVCMKIAQKYKEQANRLTLHNEELMAMLHDMEKSRQKDYSRMTTRREEGNKHSPQNFDSFCQTEELSSVQKMEPNRSPLDRLEQSVEEFSHFQEQNSELKEQINAKESRIKNLQIEKEYMSDQVMSLEKDLQETQKAYKKLEQEKKRGEAEAKRLQLRCDRLERESEVAQVELGVGNQQLHLLKQKVKQLQNKRESFPQSPSKNSRYVQVPDDNGNVTIEMLLKLLKKKQLVRYHEALMDLINKYEYQLSELKQSYMQEKQLRDRFLKHSQKIYALALSSPLSLQQLVAGICKYEEQVQHLKENQVDVLLRKVKGLSIGVDKVQYDNVVAQLEQYVYQLQARLPTLTEQYFQDGSSVTDSCYASIEKGI